MMTHEARIEYFEKMYGHIFSKDIIEKLKDLKFFDAPASSKYHLCYEGGLLSHSVNVAETLYTLTQKLDLTWQRKESPIIIGIFHDLCKCDLYIKNENGASDKKYIYNSEADQRHGIKSVEIAETIMPLTDEEKACIEFHMGAFVEKEDWSKYSNAVKQNENVLWTHCADMYSSSIIES